MQNIVQCFKKMKLSECFTFLAGGDADKLCFSETKDDMHPYPIYANALTNKGLYGYSSKYKIKDECITITGRGDIGNVFYRKGFFTPIVRLIVAIPRENINAKFMSYACSKIRFFNETTGVPQLTVPQVQGYKVLVPPLAEQEKIAEILGTWDLAIEKLTALIEQKKLLKKGLMQRLLTGKQRLPGFSEPWKKVKLGECFSFLKTSSYSRAETTDCGEVHYIHYGDIHTKYPLHIFPKDINIYISTKQASKSDCLKTGDLILLDASEDYEGTTKCVELLNISDDEKVVSGLHTLALRDSTQNFINGFRAYITSIPFVKNNFWKQVTGIKVYGVSKDNLKKIKIPIPSLSEQKAIADILSKADEEIDLLTAKLSALKSQKKGLMQKLLTGQIRVKVA